MPTALIVDDEPLLRAQLRDTLATLWPELTIPEIVGNGQDAVAAVARHKPDFVFLDIEMPIMDGLEAARLIREQTHVVFVTAYNQYAIDAFERGAVDYVLKPASIQRLSDTVKRLKTRLGHAQPDLTQLIDQLRGALAIPSVDANMQWLQATLGNRTHMVAVDDVLFFQSDTKYTRVVTRELDALVRTPLKDIIAGIDPQKFWQIHRSTVVNIRAIDRVERDEMGRQHVVLRGHAEQLEVSRSYAHLFRQSL
jgi:DNA-binding LytR/AlgR family response regulator